jgi:tripartite-type tricarboxylate transporter receptor subunit TctC
MDISAILGVIKRYQRFVTTQKRSVFLPNVPTINEFLPGFEVTAWNGIAAPKGTPAAIISKLNSEINAVFADPAISAKVTELGAEVFRAAPAERNAMLTADVAKWQKVVKFANIKPE